MQPQHSSVSTSSHYKAVEALVTKHGVLAARHDLTPIQLQMSIEMCLEVLQRKMELDKKESYKIYRRTLNESWKLFESEYRTRDLNDIAIPMEISNSFDEKTYE